MAGRWAIRWILQVWHGNLRPSCWWLTNGQIYSLWDFVTHCFSLWIIRFGDSSPRTWARPRLRYHFGSAQPVSLFQGKDLTKVKLEVFQVSKLIRWIWYSLVRTWKTPPWCCFADEQCSLRTQVFVRTTQQPVATLWGFAFVLQRREIFESSSSFQWRPQPGNAGGSSDPVSSGRRVDQSPRNLRKDGMFL